MEKNLKVNIITVSLNAEKTIEKTIKSVLNQKYSNIEYLIIDGGSKDSTIDIIKRYKINYISEKDNGIYNAMNKGIQLATGDIVHLLNADDYYSNENVISEVVRYFILENIDILHGQAELVDKNDKRVWIIGQNVSKNQLLKKMKIAHPATFIKKDIYKKYGAYCESVKIAADYDFLLRVFDKTKIKFLDKILVKMGMDGISNNLVIRSYREALCVSIIHGRNMLFAWTSYFKEICKHFCVALPIQKFRSLR